MTGLEWNNFRKLDKEEYIVYKNKDFVKYYNEKVNSWYRPSLNLDQIQDLINRITYFFEFKYPEEILNFMYHYSHNEKEIFYDFLKISTKLDIKGLKLMLSHDQRQFLECSYGEHVKLKLKDKKNNNGSYTYVSFDSNGIVDQDDLDQLVELGYLNDTQKIERVEDLLGRFIGIETDVDYTELKQNVERHKNNVVIRNKTLELVMLNMLYSKNALPEHGYIRAKKFMRMFNKEYGLDLNLDRLDEIMSINYSDNKNVKQIIKQRGKN